MYILKRFDKFPQSAKCFSCRRTLRLKKSISRAVAIQHSGNRHTRTAGTEGTLCPECAKKELEKRIKELQEIQYQLEHIKDPDVIKVNKVKELLKDTDFICWENNKGLELPTDNKKEKAKLRAILILHDIDLYLTTSYN